MTRFSAALLLCALAVHSALAMRMDKRKSVAKAAKQGPDLCDAAIVEETCFLLNGGEKHGDEDNWILPEVLRETLSAHKDDISSLLALFGLSTEKLECKELCSKIVDFIPQSGILPPSSDVGCYTIGGHTVCDLDVSPDALHDLGLAPDKDLPDFHDKKFLEKKAAFMLAQLKLNDTADAPSALMQATAADDLEIEYGHWELVERMANMFRIYPAEKAGGIVSVANSHQQWTSYQESLNKQKETLSKAYMATTIRKFNAYQTRTQMTNWFGSAAYSNSATRREILRVLNSVDHMISNVEYVYPGPQCESNVYAYVYPTAYTCSYSSELTRNACTKYQGRFVFYLCPFYFQRTSEMVETLVHEGSHHSTAFTDDVDYNGGTAYGRSVCKSLARNNPSKALKNADNFCYYIEDVGATR